MRCSSFMKATEKSPQAWATASAAAAMAPRRKRAEAVLLQHVPRAARCAHKAAHMTAAPATMNGTSNCVHCARAT